MNWFTPHPFENKRLKTHTVKIGSLNLGSSFPVRVQSMANTPTHDIQKSIHQAIEIIEAGGELVRFTVINAKDAEALKHIKAGLVEKGYHTPLVADIHFNANLADMAAKYVEKVRINPGNYLEKRATFALLDFTDEEYQTELAKLEHRFSEFLDICFENQTAVRIGTNHGSLSDRIMSRYGDTPEGMVEATMEFLRICHKKNFKNVVVSLKSSNTRVMVYAYRLLAQQMQIENMLFALHLGVTEAGSGEDGRIKSAVGIGSLMHDGLGDTIRVSLTEHPAKEIPVAKSLVSHLSKFSKHNISKAPPLNTNPFTYKKRITKPEFAKALVIADLSTEKELTDDLFFNLGFTLNNHTHCFEAGDMSPDVVFVGEHLINFKFDSQTKLLVDGKYWENVPNTFPLYSVDEYLMADNKSQEQNWVQINYQQLSSEIIEKIKLDQTLVLVCFSYNANYVQEIRLLIHTLIQHKINCPVVIQHSYTQAEVSQFQLISAADSGIFFIDGLADGLWLKNTFRHSNKNVCDTAYAILQASRTRISKTEYISCPGCGRTLFNLEKSLAEIKQGTQHLKGLKIAIMGCIVNGPGEMADADYGYVGAGPGKVTLYKGKNVIMPNIDSKQALEKLLWFIENDLKQ